MPNLLDPAAPLNAPASVAPSVIPPALQSLLSPGGGPAASAGAPMMPPTPAGAPPTVPPPGTSVPTPGTAKPSILQRLLQTAKSARLFPSDPAYGDILDPQDQSYLQGSAIRRLGLGMLSNSGPAPRGTTNLGSRIGAAASGVDWEGMQRQAAQTKIQTLQTAMYYDQMRRMRAVVADPETAINNGDPTAEIARKLAVRIGKLAGIGGPANDAIGQYSDLVKSLQTGAWKTGEERDPSGVSRPYMYNEITGEKRYTVAGPGAGPAGSTTTPSNGPGMQSEAGYQKDSERRTAIQNQYLENTRDLRSKFADIRSAIGMAPSAATDRTGNAQGAFLRLFINSLGVQGARPGEVDMKALADALPYTVRAQHLAQKIAGHAPLTAEDINDMTAVLRRMHNSYRGQMLEVQNSLRQGNPGLPQLNFEQLPNAYPEDDGAGGPPLNGPTVQHGGKLHPAAGF